MKYCSSCGNCLMDAGRFCSNCGASVLVQGKKAAEQYTVDSGNGYEKLGVTNYIYPDGTTYEGEWKGNKRHGHGMWTKPDGTSYVGDWVNDKPNGQGTLTLPNGKKHTGEWKDGSLHGPGVEIHPDGTKLYGKWEDGIFVGESKPTVEDESLSLGFSEARKESDFQPRDNNFDSIEAKHYRQKQTRKRSLIWPGLLVVTIILVLAAIVFILTNSEDKYTVSGRVANYAGEGIAGVTIGFGEGYGTAKTDENGYWAKSDLQGEITVTPQFGNVLFNPIRSETSKATDKINFTLLKEVDKGVTSSAGEYVFSSHLTAAEDIELTVIVDDYESGEKLEGIDVEVVIGGDTIEIFLQDDEGFYLPTIIVLEIDRLEDYPGVEVKRGSLLVSIRTRLLSNNYLQWAIQNPREASADVALSIAVGLDVYGAISYTAGGIAIMTAPATAGASALPGAGAIAAGFAMDIVSTVLKVYAADVYRGIEKTEHPITIYIYESHESASHAKLLVPAGTSIDEIIKAVESEVGDREYEIIAPETNPAGAYYNNDGTPKFLKVILKDQTVQVFSNNLFIYPVKEYQNNITQGFGNYLPDYAGKKYNGFHSAEDITVFASAPVFSIADGTVEKIAKLGNLGHLVALKHDGNFIIPSRAEHKGNQYYEYPTEEVSTIYSIYVHVTPINGLKEKQSVTRGQKIGYIADISSAGLRPHLHFEIRHPKQKSSSNWSLVGDESNWTQFAGGSYNGYYKNLQEMVDAGLRHPSDFFSQNISDPEQKIVEQGGDKPIVKESADRQYSIINAAIQIEILEDGSMNVKEKRTYSFNGSFKGLYQWFNKKSGIEFIDFKVEENGVFFDFNPGNTYGPKGTFYIDEKPDFVLVDWSIEAKDEEKTFVLHYKVLNAIKVHNNKAELYWKFIGDEWEVPTEKVITKIIIPNGANTQEIEAIVYGPIYGEVTVISPSEIIWQTDYLPEKTYFEGRVIFPARILRDFNY